MATHSEVERQPSSLLRVSVVCFRWADEQLETLLTSHGGLPAVTPDINETLDSAALRVIAEQAQIPAAYVEQLYTFGYLEGSVRETNISYMALFGRETPGDAWHMESSARNVLDDQDVTTLDYAFTRLRAKLEYTSIAFHLMPPVFTLAELQLMYEGILGTDLDKRNFRRRMIASGMLHATGEKRREGPHRPAELYRYSGEVDHSSYLTPRSISAVDGKDARP